MINLKKASAGANAVAATPKEAANEVLLDAQKVPRHVAIIMDGNGRWAKQRNLPRIAGHRAGTENIRRIIESCIRYGVRHLSLYAFSTENWNRPEEEVKGLLAILGEVIERETPKLHAEGVRINHLGRLDGLSPHLRRALARSCEKTSKNERLSLNVCYNYGGRLEIVDAVRKIVAEGFAPDQIDETLISRYLYPTDSPDPDLIIRTAGEQRLSNFLIWQAAYSEYWFTPLYWPDFGKDEFFQALLEYTQRLRKFGKTPEQVLAPNA
jgi:undecaprenyl diphosphate synthase